MEVEMRVVTLKIDNNMNKIKEIKDLEINSILNCRP